MDALKLACPGRLCFLLRVWGPAARGIRGIRRSGESEDPESPKIRRVRRSGESEDPESPKIRRARRSGEPEDPESPRVRDFRTFGLPNFQTPRFSGSRIFRLPEPRSLKTNFIDLKMNTIVVNEISKRYGSVQAVDALTFSVSEGELFGIIGPDGAGKTTLIRILVTLLLPDTGTGRVDGLDVVQDYRLLRQRLGYMPGRFSLYPDLTVEENLNFFATVFGTTVAKNYDLIKDIYQQIEPFKKRKAGQLSGGMKQKLALSCALIHRPRVLFLDEPTTGVDAVSRQEFWEMLARLKASGITILVTTPYMDEASLCDRIALMQNSRLLALDAPANIEATYDAPLFAVKANDRYRLLQALRAFPHARYVYPFGEYIHYTDTRNEAKAEELRRYLAALDFQEIDAHPIQANIEDVFMARMQATNYTQEA